MANQSQRKLFILLLFLILDKKTLGFRCDRRPYGSTTQPSPADGRYKLIVSDTDDTYIPDQLYTVQLKETDDESRFTSFVISAEGDLKPDPRNPRRMVSLYPGDLRPLSSATAKFSDRCLYSVEQAISSSKPSVEVYWQAPPSGSGCVTLRAMVAENEEVWFEDGSPLTKRLCEDMRQPDDIATQLNYDCQICDEAKYELTFTGVWSRHTHSRLYPENDWVPRYSDLVGASHAADFILWSPGTLASDGLRNLAEHANSSMLEAEIREKIGDGVRTVIKGKGHSYPKMNMPTYAFFRADKTNHLITASIALHPSPDWFLGITRFELCQQDNTWLQERELNLFPWDAGTDSGVSYESLNIETFPQDAVSRVQMSSYDKNSPFYEVDMKDLHPFGKLHIQLIRTYHRECEETTDKIETTTSEETEIKEEPEEKPTEPIAPSRYQNFDVPSGDDGGEEPTATDSESSEECPMTEWQEWSPCEGICRNGKLIGYKRRERYHLVDGIAVEKYDPNRKANIKKEVSVYCKTHYDDFESTGCEEDCSDSDNNKRITAERRRVYKPIIPGHTWSSKKRDLPKSKNLYNKAK